MNRIQIVEEIPPPPTEITNCETEKLANNDTMEIAVRSGDDLSTIGASDQEQELLNTYSIAAELVDAINENEGNTGLVFPENQKDECSAVPDKVTQNDMDNMLSDLDIDNLKDIPDNKDGTQINEGNSGLVFPQNQND